MYSFPLHSPTFRKPVPNSMEKKSSTSSVNIPLINLSSEETPLSAEQDDVVQALASTDGHTRRRHTKETGEGEEREEVSSGVKHNRLDVVGRRRQKCSLQMPQRKQIVDSYRAGRGRRLEQGSTNSELLGLLPCAARSRLGPKALHHFFRAAGENVVPAKSLEPPYPATTVPTVLCFPSVSSLAIGNAFRAACESALSRMTSSFGSG